MGTRNLALLGVLAAMAVALHAAAVFWPPAGGFLAGFAVLPVALAALLAPGRAPLMAAAAAGLLASVSVREVLVFSLLNAPLGLVLGYAQAAGWPRGAAVPAAALPVFAGLMVLTFGLGIPFLGVRGAGLLPGGALFLAFGLAYAWAWTDFLARLHRRLGPFLDRYRQRGP